MPELPDVEVFKDYFESHTLGKKVREVEVRSNQVLTDLKPKTLQDRLVEKSFSSTRRHGKHLFISTNEAEWIRFHFGMTGFFRLYGTEEKMTGHPRVIFVLSEGTELAYDCQRKLGEIDLLSDPLDYIAKKGLGPDALRELSWKRFFGIFASGRAMAKSTLMDQSKMAGIGNIYSDEILFQSGVHPRKRTKDLSQEETHKVYDALTEVLQEAINCEVEPDRMPPHYLLPHREKGELCPKCGTELEKVSVSGRSAYLCPNCQPIPQ